MLGLYKLTLNQKVKAGLTEEALGKRLAEGFLFFQNIVDKYHGQSFGLGQT
jgi:hypothetical protein